MLLVGGYQPVAYLIRGETSEGQQQVTVQHGRLIAVCLRGLVDFYPIEIIGGDLVACPVSRRTGQLPGRLYKTPLLIKGILPGSLKYDPVPRRSPPSLVDVDDVL